jgi:hypothetical protein
MDFSKKKYSVHSKYSPYRGKSVAVSVDPTSCHTLRLEREGLSSWAFFNYFLPLGTFFRVN